MPTYQYVCDKCHHEMEVIQSMTAKKMKKCPECGKLTLTRLIGGGSGIIFKGSGFYETDYKKKGPVEKESAKPTVKKTSAAGGCGSGCACHN